MMVYVVMLEQRKLATLLQRIECYEKTGLLTITQGEHRVELFFQQGQITGMGPLQWRAMVKKLLQAGFIARHDVYKALQVMGGAHNEKPYTAGHSAMEIALTLTELGLVSRERLCALATQEVAEVVQDLLTWSAGDISFEAGVPSPTDPLLALRLTSLLPSLLVTPPLIPRTPRPLLFKKSKPAAEKPSTPALPFPGIPVMPLPPTLEAPKSALQEQPGPALSIIVTLVQRAIVPSRVASLLHPSPDALTVKLSKVGRRQSSALRWEVLLIVAILLITALAHGFNMFNLPYYEDDEGTYMSQAWAVIHEGQLAPYTYWYDHAPVGWIQIAAWTIVSGGFHTFGTAIESGRVLMLLMQVCSTLMLYCIARRISRSITIAVITSLLFALSPYGIYFHRRVLLDNITTFWMLLSVLLLVWGRLPFKRVWLSALALGISILSKELTVFLVPIMAYLVFFRTDRSRRWIAMFGWITLVGSVVSMYVLMAVLKGELFPTGTLLGGTAPHVSLLGTLQFQASRGKDGGLLDFHSGFWQLAKTWATDDPMLVVGGSLSAILSVLIRKKQRLVSIMGMLTLSLCVFLGRGGEIIGFYLVPLLPLLALDVGLMLGLIIHQVKTSLAGRAGILLARAIELVAVGLCLVSMWAGYTSPDLGFKSDPLLLWNNAQAVAQKQAIAWVREHLPTSSRIVIDQYMWTDLYDSGYKFADYYWKVAQDPAIGGEKYHNNWRNFDYVVTTIQMLTDVKANQMTLVEEAIEHSTAIAHFDSGGWPIEVLKVNKPGVVLSPPGVST